MKPQSRRLSSWDVTFQGLERRDSYNHGRESLAEATPEVRSSIKLHYYLAQVQFTTTYYLSARAPFSRVVHGLMSCGEYLSTNQVATLPRSTCRRSPELRSARESVSLVFHSPVVSLFQSSNLMARTSVPRS